MVAAWASGNMVVLKVIFQARLGRFVIYKMGGPNPEILIDHAYNKTTIKSTVA